MINQDTQVERLLRDGFTFSATDALSEGWELFKRDAVKFVLYALLIGAISAVLYRLGTFGSVVNNLISPILIGGYFYGYHRVATGGQLEFSEFFRSFDKWLPLMVSGILISIGISIGLVLLLIPGLWLALSAFLVTPLIIFRNYDFWPAITTSVKVSQKDIGNFIVLFLILIGINLLGALAFGIGLLVTIPVSIGAIYSTYSKVIGLEGEPYSSPNMFRVD